jgi:hypothetical protein
VPKAVMGSASEPATASPARGGRGGKRQRQDRHERQAKNLPDHRGTSFSDLSTASVYRHQRQLEARAVT